MQRQYRKRPVPGRVGFRFRLGLRHDDPPGGSPRLWQRRRGVPRRSPFSQANQGFCPGTGPPGARFTTYSWSLINVLGTCVDSRGTTRTMKILQCACILGAIAALYSLAQRAPARTGELSLAGGEVVALASLDVEHANLERDFASLTLANADPTPVASLGTRTVAAIAIKPVVVASINSSSPKALAFDDPRPDAYFDPRPIGPANPIVVASLGLVPVSQEDLA